MDLSETEELRAQTLMLRTCLFGLLDALEGNAVAPIPVRSPEFKRGFLIAAHLRFAALAKDQPDEITARAVELYEEFGGRIVTGMRRS